MISQSHTVNKTTFVHGMERCIKAHVRIKLEGAQTAHSSVPEVSLPVTIVEQLTNTDAANNSSA